jgi:hypothetical protein
MANKKNKLISPILSASPAQSLVETIVATSIVTIALVGILSLALSTLSLGGQGAEWVLAINLGREELEICQTIRASNWFDEATSWPFGLSTGEWVANYGDTSLTTSTPSGINNCLNCIVCFNPADQTYSQADGSGSCGALTRTNYRRLITIANGDDLGGACGADCERKVQVAVQWTQENQTHNILLEKRFTNWR